MKLNIGYITVLDEVPGPRSSGPLFILTRVQYIATTDYHMATNRHLLSSYKLLNLLLIDNFV